MLSQIVTANICYMDVQIVRVETLVFDGLPDIEVVGDVDSKVKESVRRVLSAIKNAGIRLPPKKLIINFYPTDIRKSGSQMDFAIAVSIMGAYAFINKKRFTDTLFIGEIGLSGNISRVNGALPIVMEGQKKGIKKCYVPYENLRELSLVEDMEVCGLRSLQEFIHILQGKKAENTSFEQFMPLKHSSDVLDFKDLLGQDGVKRGAKIAAAGMHSLLMIGPPGTGKTMTAKRVLDILPPLSEKEQLELSKLYSLAGMLSEEEPYITERKIRTVNAHVAGKRLLGQVKKGEAGEMMLANRGILFLDELSSFSPNILEIIRQPFDEKKQIIDIDGRHLEYPTCFMLVACMNACKCGAFPDMSRCTCSISDIKRHAGRIAQSFLDRIEIAVHFPDVSYDMISGDSVNSFSESSDMMREDIYKAYEIQKARYKNTDFITNADVSGECISKYCRLKKKQEKLFKLFYESEKLSVRTCHNILRVSRTIADLAQSEEIEENHLMEAIGLRSIDRRFWKV